MRQRPPAVFTGGVSTPHTSLPRVRASALTGRNWLNTGGRTLTLDELRGKIVILDFWTFCCINCLHVLDELRELEEQHRDELVIIGVHSPKFVHEADPDALAAAVERYGVAHPVLDDPTLSTWQAYTARAWPTLVVIDPEGYIVAHMAGEGHAPALARIVTQLIEDHDARGTLHRGSGPYVPPPTTAGMLSFPAKAVPLPAGGYLVADAGHHQIVHVAADGVTEQARYGAGERGLVDGPAHTAQFNELNGLLVLPPDVAAEVGYDVVVADTVNHCVRSLSLSTGVVGTLAGNGRQYMVGGPDNEGRLTSPWDVVWSAHRKQVIIAMAGNHTLWTLDPRTGQCQWFAGTMNEGLVDGPVAQSWFAQPSGLAVTGVDADERVWVADSETSALRWIDTSDTVHTAVGAGLFDFGHRDGDADQALFQHPLAVAALPDSSLVVADTYNGALRRYDPATRTVSTLASGLAEPSGMVVHHEGGELSVVVVESAAHQLTGVALPASLVGEVLDTGAHRTQRPTTAVRGGQVDLRVVFTPAPGQKYDDRFGPSTRLSVSATPENLLLDGAGDTVELTRTVRINPDVEQGVLHVTAQAASCDDDPAIEFPACHLAQQDWGVPVTVSHDGADSLDLSLRG